MSYVDTINWPKIPVEIREKFSGSIPGGADETCRIHCTHYSPASWREAWCSAAGRPGDAFCLIPRKCKQIPEGALKQ